MDAQDSSLKTNFVDPVKDRFLIHPIIVTSILRHRKYALIILYPRLRIRSIA